MLSRIVPYFGLIIVNFLLFICLYFGPVYVQVPETIAVFADYLPILAIICTLLLALRFNQSRFCLAASVCGLLFFLLCFFIDTPWSSRAQLLSFLIFPLFMGFLVWKKENGLISSPGIPWTVITALLWSLPIVLWLIEPAFFTQLAKPLLEFIKPRQNWIFTASFSLGLGSCLLAYWIKKGTCEITMLSMLLFGFFAIKQAIIQPNDDIVSSEILFFGAQLAALLGIFEGSHNLAYRDELTGVPGRRALLEAMAKLGSHYAIAMSDIDHFKKFNDTYGHDTGDEVLIKVAGILSTVGGGGRAYRYGGEEFVIIFDGLSSEEAVVYLEKLRLAVAGSKLEVYKPAKGKRPAQKVDVKITISMGVAEPDEYLSKPERVLKAADKALYMAKENGRNQVQDYRNPNVEKKNKKKAPAKKPAAKKSAESAAGDKPKLKIVKNSGRENKKSA